MHLPGLAQRLRGGARGRQSDPGADCHGNRRGQVSAQPCHHPSHVRNVGLPADARHRLVGPGHSRSNAAMSDARPEDRAKARAQFQRGVALQEADRLDAAASAFAEAAELWPGMGRAHLRRGIVLAELDRPEAAVASLQRACDLLPERDDAWFHLANAHQKTGGFASAAAAFQTAARLRPDWADAWFNLGVCRQRCGQLDDAIAAFETARRLRPDWDLASYHLAAARQIAGRDIEAMAAFRDALDLRPDWPEAWFALGTIQLAHGVAVDAVNAFGETLRLRPNWDEASLHLGLARMAAGEYGGADQALRRALELRPRWAEAALQLAIALAQRPDYAAAEAMLRDAVAWAPDASAPHLHLGLMRRAQGDAAEALACFRRAAELEPRSLPARTHLARALMVANAPEATRAWREAVALEPKMAAPARRVIFVHIPKCGGSTVYGLFAGHYPPTRTLSVDRDSEIAALRTMPTEIADALYFVGGHGKRSDFARFEDGNPLFVTVLRDPVERLDSTWRYLARNPFLHDGPAAALGTLDSYVAFQERRAGRRANQQCRYVSGGYRAGPAIAALERDFALVGVTERLPAFIAALGEAAGIPTDSLTSYNVDRTSQREPIPAALRARIETLCAQDMALYRAAAERAP